MNKIIINTLLAMVCMLLILSVFILIYALLYGIGKMEIGSISDWVSSLSTLGTLYVAAVALRKAPEWLDQKKYNIAHEIIENSIYNNLQKVRTTSQQLKLLFNTNSNESIKALDAGVIHPSLEKIAYDLDSLIDDYSIVTYSIINDLNKICRSGYVLSEYSISIINTLKESNLKYQNIFNYSFLTAYYEIESLKESSEQAKELTKQEFKSVIKEVNELHKNLAKFTSNIYSDNYPFEHFIISGKLK